MSFEQKWNIEKYREEHESDEHWELRRTFMKKWKDNYSEERLVCLARVFANIEFMGCRYPTEVMQEVAKLSQEVAKDYRNIKKTKLQRTFVSASDAAEDRAKGIKREGGIIVDSPATKTTRIQFVPQTKSTELLDNRTNNNLLKEHSNDHKQSYINFTKQTSFDNNGTKSENNREFNQYALNNESLVTKLDSEAENEKQTEKTDRYTETSARNSDVVAAYITEMSKVKCLNVHEFRESMFNTLFGKFVLIVRPWTGKLNSVQASCMACNIPMEVIMESLECTIKINGKVVVQEHSVLTNMDAKTRAGNKIWNKLKHEAIVLVMKEQWVAQDGTKVSHSDVSHRSRSSKFTDDMFGKPVDNTVASKMMKMMGWKGGGLGADAQGIAEPIKPHLQIVNRAGLGSTSSDIRQLRQAANSLMQRYAASDSLDVDLVFSSDFNKEERAALHQVARRYKLVSRSYGTEDIDRFLVIKKKVDPFSLVRAVIQKGGITQKYQVFIPEKLKNTR